MVEQTMAIENPPTANEPATRETQTKSPSLLAWLLGILSGGVLTVILIAALVWLSTGLGLFHLMSALRQRPHPNHRRSTHRRPPNSKLQRLEP